jgi:hypothetical protein
MGPTGVVVTIADWMLAVSGRSLSAARGARATGRLFEHARPIALAPTGGAGSLAGQAGGGGQDRGKHACGRTGDGSDGDIGSTQALHTMLFRVVG